MRVANDESLTRAGLDNEGFKGIGLKAGEEYRLSFYARTPAGAPVKLSVELVNSNSENRLKKEVEISGKEWKKVTMLLKSPFTDAHSRLRLVLTTAGNRRYGPYLPVPGKYVEES